MGFGHRVYKNYDPRATIIKKAAYEVFEVTGTNPLLDIALELEKIALEDDYFVERKLYPNVDFYSGLIYEALGLPMAMFPVMFAIPRTSGWVAQWLELVVDKEQKIARPRQIYTGLRTRDYVAYVALRGDAPKQLIAVARMVRLDTNPAMAEVAVVVGDCWQRRGLGKLLGDHLAVAARDRGVRWLTATMAADNQPAHRLFG